MARPTRPRLALQSAKGPSKSAFEMGMAEPDEGCLGPAVRTRFGLRLADGRHPGTLRYLSDRMGEHMGIEREFQSYGAQLVNRAWAVSAITDDPREVVVSIWQHNIAERAGRWVYDDSLARWNGAGKNLLKQHLGVAYREGLPLRAVVATQHNRAERERNPDKAPRNTFKARPDWVGRVELLDGDHFVLAFDHVGETTTAPTGTKYWRVAEAVEAMGGGTLAEVGEWLETHFSSDPIADLRANLEHLTVNSPSRPHYNYSRSDWRTDRVHPHDRLFKIVNAGPPRRTRYVPFNPAVHGHLDLQKGDDGKWVVVPLPQDDQTRAEAQGQADAFDHAPPLDNEHWTAQSFIDTHRPLCA